VVDATGMNSFFVGIVIKKELENEGHRRCHKSDIVSGNRHNLFLPDSIELQRRFPICS